MLLLRLLLAVYCFSHALWAADGQGRDIENPFGLQVEYERLGWSQSAVMARCRRLVVDVIGQWPTELAVSHQQDFRSVMENSPADVQKVWQEANAIIQAVSNPDLYIRDGLGRSHIACLDDRAHYDLFALWHLLKTRRASISKDGLVFGWNLPVGMVSDDAAQDYSQFCREIIQRAFDAISADSLRPVGAHGLSERRAQMWYVVFDFLARVRRLGEFRRDVVFEADERQVMDPGGSQDHFLNEIALRKMIGSGLSRLPDRSLMEVLFAVLHEPATVLTALPDDVSIDDVVSGRYVTRGSFALQAIVAGPYSVSWSWGLQGNRLQLDVQVRITGHAGKGLDDVFRLTAQPMDQGLANLSGADLLRSCIALNDLITEDEGGDLLVRGCVLALRPSILLNNAVQQPAFYRTFSRPESLSRSRARSSFGDIEDYGSMFRSMQWEQGDDDGHVTIGDVSYEIGDIELARYVMGRHFTGICNGGSLAPAHDHFTTFLGSSRNRVIAHHGNVTVHPQTVTCDVRVEGWKLYPRWLLP